MSVFVLDRLKKPLMPCSEKRARLLLRRKRAVVHRLWPFTIRLKDRTHTTSQMQPVALKLDPGSKTTGVALVRVEDTAQGEVHHALHLAELSHRGQQVHQALRQRAGYRRRRRSANLRHRQPRFVHRRRSAGWLHPSLRSRIGNVLSWAIRYQRWAPVTRIEVERVKFDLALMQNPEISGVAYQRGELFGWELRSYLLEKFGRQCSYCGGRETAFELDHVVPKSRGGSDRASNLVLSCHECNAAKGDKTAAEWGYPEVEARAKAPLRDAAAVNAARYALGEALGVQGLPIGTWSGGRTRWNRDRFGIVRWGSRRGSPACYAHSAHHGTGAWPLPAHQRRWIRVPPWVSLAPQAHPGLFHRRPGACQRPRASLDSRHPCGASRGQVLWLVSRGECRWN